MKKLICLVMAVILICAFALGCAADTEPEGVRPTEATSASGLPDTVAGEPEQPPKAGDNITPTDYSDAGNWMRVTDNPNMPVDVFYLYPTAWSRQEGEPYYCEIDNKGMRQGAQYNLLSQASAYGQAGNIYAPYYRQMDAAYLLELPIGQQTEYMYGVPYTDAVAAFEYYLEHYNDGRPFILAGHSQGSNVLKLMLISYMKDHPDVLGRMVAAYIIGYSVTQQELDDNPHLKFAEGKADTGVIVSYNTEAPEIESKSPVALPDSVSINPLLWTRTDEIATAEMNLGSRFYDRETGEYEDVAHLADAAVNLERGTVVCSTVDTDEYSLSGGGLEEIFPRGVLHGSDYPFYYHNLSENAVDRSANYLYAADKESNIVETSYGKVRGAAWDGVVSYKGVPFALPPVGEYRFAQAGELMPWDGVLNCTSFGDSAVQSKDEENLTYSEDCLYLNIWAPEDADGDSPVLVFIHGGAYSQGSPSKSMYDGTRFAQDGVVQVNVSYRLNALGFMPSEELDDETGYIGNAGVLDQIAALEWVKENIAAFGGDPDNITISGESAGSFSVSNLILSPLAEGLFNKAILESGNLLGQQMVAALSNGDVSQALGNADRLMDAVRADDLQSMREADASEIAEQSSFEMNIIQPSDKAFFPVFDGKILPENPYEALMGGNYNDVAILGGYNTDEGTLFVEEGISEQDYINLLENTFGEDADTVLERYPVDESHTATDRARFIMKMGLRMGTDIFADKLSADGQDAYLYHFAYDVPALNAAGLGTMHALELPFVFDSFGPAVNISDEARAAIEEIHGRWLGFIKSGDPNDGDFAVEWEKYTPDGKQTMVLSGSPTMAPAEQTEDIEFFRSLLWD